MLVRCILISFRTGQKWFESKFCSCDISISSVGFSLRCDECDKCYLDSHQGSTKAAIARGLRGIISKKTIGRLVNGMIKNKIVESKKENENARDHKLYLKEDNQLVYVILQLDEFEKTFENLLYCIIENIKYIRSNKFTGKSTEELSAMDDANFFHFCNVSPFLIGYQMYIQHMQ